MCQCQSPAGIFAFYFSTLEQMSMASPQIQVLSPNPVTLLLPSPLAAHLCFTSKLGTIFTAMKFFILKASFFSFLQSRLQ